MQQGRAPGVAITRQTPDRRPGDVVLVWRARAASRVPQPVSLIAAAEPLHIEDRPQQVVANSLAVRPGLRFAGEPESQAGLKYAIRPLG